MRDTNRELVNANEDKLGRKWEMDRQVGKEVIHTGGEVISELVNRKVGTM